MQLRDYQTTAANRVIRKLAVDDDHGTLLVLPTGTGKTIVFSNVARRWIEGRSERVLVLAHRKELIEQARDKLLLSTDLKEWEVGIERASTRSAAGQPVVVASVQTLQNKRLERFRPEAFGLVVVDEAHHVPAASYRKVLNHFRFAKRLGVTATPYRLDGENLGTWFDSYAYQYELAQAIEDGWLVPVVARRVLLEDLDLSRVKKTAGDFNKAQLADVMERRVLIDRSGRAHPRARRRAPDAHLRNVGRSCRAVGRKVQRTPPRLRAVDRWQLGAGRAGIYLAGLRRRPIPVPGELRPLDRRGRHPAGGLCRHGSADAKPGALHAGSGPWHTAPGDVLRRIGCPGQGRPPGARFRGRHGQASGRGRPWTPSSPVCHRPPVRRPSSICEMAGARWTSPVKPRLPFDRKPRKPCSTTPRGRSVTA